EGGPTGPAAPWSSLEARGLLVERRPAPNRELAFRHGVLQEVVYESLLQESRRLSHARAARVLAADASAQPELAVRVASHWGSAGDAPEALAWTFRAADHAAALHSGQEAWDLYGQARDLAQACGSNADHARA